MTKALELLFEISMTSVLSFKKKKKKNFHAKPIGFSITEKI